MRATASRAAAAEEDVRLTHVALAQPAEWSVPPRHREGFPVHVPAENAFYNGEGRGYTDEPTRDALQNGTSFDTLDSLRELTARG